jgi:predicted Zn-ribbon and HTH transcriptional regulator
MTSQTRRAQIRDLLSLHPMTLHTLARHLRVRVADLNDDLEHLRRSLGDALQVEPASCDGCGFSFRKRDRFTAPSRCPQCRSERIRGPWLSASPSPAPDPDPNPT